MTTPKKPTPASSMRVREQEARARAEEAKLARAKLKRKGKTSHKVGAITKHGEKAAHHGLDSVLRHVSASPAERQAAIKRRRVLR